MDARRALTGRHHKLASRRKAAFFCSQFPAVDKSCQQLEWAFMFGVTL
jgi:hypothetical protein